MPNFSFAWSKFQSVSSMLKISSHFKASVCGKQIIFEWLPILPACRLRRPGSRGSFHGNEAIFDHITQRLPGPGRLPPASGFGTTIELERRFFMARWQLSNPFWSSWHPAVPREPLWNQLANLHQE
jgi:hypothetical protein